MDRSRPFRWNSLVDSFIFLALTSAINYVWFRHDPAFRSLLLHPYLLPITLIGLFYGFREALACVLLCNVFYTTQLVLAGYSFGSLATQPDLRNIIGFLLAGL